MTPEFKCPRCGNFSFTTPDLTEALARLKALEEAIGRYGRYPGIEPCDEWADEIAAIRNLLERKES